MKESSIESLATSGMTGLELEIAQAQAEALGLAGKRLQDSIDQYRRSLKAERSTSNQDALLGEIVERAWALIVQRELIGFNHENLPWIQQNFDIPERAMVKLGRDECS